MQYIRRKSDCTVRSRDTEHKSFEHARPSAGSQLSCDRNSHSNCLSCDIVDRTARNPPFRDPGRLSPGNLRGGTKRTVSTSRSIARQHGTRACGCDVRARQREACQIVIERGSGPRTRRVATVALLTECRQRVNRIVCIVVVFNVTGNTFVRSSGIARRMALLTICRQMRAGQLELR